MRRELMRSSRVSASVPPMLGSLSMMGHDGMCIRRQGSPRIAIHLIVLCLLCHVEGGWLVTRVGETVVVWSRADGARERVMFDDEYSES